MSGKPLSAFLSPSGGITMGCEAEAITSEIAFRHLIWKFVVPLHGIPWLSSHKVSPLGGLIRKTVPGLLPPGYMPRPGLMDW